MTASLPSSSFMPRVAMVLAAGLGLRMRPLTLERPKPLLQIAGRTLLDHTLDHLAAAGVERAVVNTHYRGEQIAAHVAGREKPAITLSPEATPLETGGGIRKALPHLGTEPFFVANADIVWFDGPEATLRRLASMWDPAQMDALLLLTPTESAFGYSGPGDFFLGRDGRVRRGWDDGIAPYVFAGVHITRPGPYAGGPEVPFSCNRVWDRMLAAGRLFGVAHQGAWYHLGTPEALIQAEHLVASHLSGQGQDRPERAV